MNGFHSFSAKEVFFVAFLLFAFPLSFQAKIYYVSPFASGEEDGSSWQNASSDLQRMINGEQPGDSVFVSQGVYAPRYDATVEDSNADAGADNVFLLTSGVSLFGGFDEEEAPDFASRDWKKYPTVLSGRWGDDEADRTYQLLIACAVENFLLDGFEIRDGLADLSGASRNVNGIAAYKSGASAIYAESSSGILKNLYIHNNMNPGSGTTIFLKLCDITIAHTEISHNQAFVGGGIYIMNTTLRVYNSFFYGNVAQAHGGAIDLSDSESLIINSSFINNQATAGGGGALYANAKTSLVVVNSTLIGNTALKNGAGIYTFTNRSAIPLVMHNSVLYNNTGLDKYGKPVIENILLQSNAVITHSFVQGESLSGANNLNDKAGTITPCFVSEPEHIFRLTNESPLIDAGDLAMYESYRDSAYHSDLSSNARIYGGKIDIGAYEYQPNYWTGAASPEWNNPANWSTQVIPRSGEEVVLRESAGTYPDLQAADHASCHSIRFEMGSTLGNQHLLAYDKAFVELNVGYYEEENGNFGSELQDLSSSGNALQRDRDYLLAAPLQNMIAGDYFLGGKPNVYASYVDISLKEESASLSGLPTLHFTNPLPDYTVPIGFADGFAFWINPSLAKRNETGGTSIPLVYDQTNLNKYNGIMQFPRIPYYIDYNPYESFDPATHTSSFHYFQRGYPDRPDLQKEPAVFSRTLYDEARSIYHANRFVTEVSDIESGISVSKEVLLLADGTPADLLIGNPFMAYFDFPAFYKANKERIAPYYRLWDGTKVVSFYYDELTDQLLADQPEPEPSIHPMQAFLVSPKVTGGQEEKIDLFFDASMAYANKALETLRNNSPEMKTARIVLSGSRFESSVGMHFYSEEDSPRLPKLFPQEPDVPELYLETTDHSEKYAFLSVTPGESYRLGILSRITEAFSIRLEGNLPPGCEVLLSDQETGSEHSLTSFAPAYTFQAGKLPLTNRFSLRIKDATTGVNDVPFRQRVSVSVQDKLLAVSSDATIQSLRLIDLSGRTLYCNENINQNRFTFPKKELRGICILSVRTYDGISTHKLVL